MQVISDFQVFDDLPVGVQVINSRMEYVYLNRNLLSEVGRRREEMEGQRMQDVFPGIELTEVYATILDCLESGKSRSLLNRFTFPDGRNAYYELKIGRISEGVILFSTDVTTQKTRELQLRATNRELEQRASESEEILRSVLDSSLDGVMYLKALRTDGGDIYDFRYVFANRVACEIMKKEEKDLVGQTLLGVLPEHKEPLPEYGRSLFDLYREVVETGDSRSLLFEFQSDDVSGWFSNRSVRLGDGFVVTFSVVTEMVNKTRELERLNAGLQVEVQREVRKNQEQQEALIQQSKLAAMGDMISAIAHQWRQPLNAVELGLQVIEDIVSRNVGNLSEEDRKEFEEVSHTAQERILYLSETIEDFRQFYSPSQKKEEFALLDVVLGSCRFFEEQMHNHGIECKVDPGLSGLRVFGNANQLRQVLLNLISNSIEAFRVSGASRKRIEMEAVPCEAGQICLQIKDTAGGIPKGILPRIFEPYFSSKGPTSGSGIGLYISRLIIEKTFGGTLQARNSEDGALFEIRIPHEHSKG